MSRGIRSFLLLLTGIGCRSPTEPLAQAIVVTTVAPTNNSVIRVTITTTVTNSAWRTLRLETNACPHRFRVETLAGTRVELIDQICAAISLPVTLAPGQSYNFVEQWDGTVSNGERVSGTYRVVGQPFLDQGPQSAPVLVEFPE